MASYINIANIRPANCTTSIARSGFITPNAVRATRNATPNVHNTHVGIDARKGPGNLGLIMSRIIFVSSCERVSNIERSARLVIAMPPVTGQ